MIRQCYISDKLEEELKWWYDFFNKISEKNTSYSIRQGNPTASEICASILKVFRSNIKDFKIDIEADEKYTKKVKIKGTIKCDVDIDVMLDKIKGVKKNDISFE